MEDLAIIINNNNNKTSCLIKPGLHGCSTLVQKGQKLRFLNFILFRTACVRYWDEKTETT